MNQTFLKVCKKCGVEKPYSAFYSNHRMKDGILNTCKICEKARVKQNRLDKIDYYKKYDKERNSCSARIQARKNYSQTEKGKSVLKLSVYKYRKNNPEKRKAHLLVEKAIKDEVLISQPCITCGDSKSQAHHEDYSKPLEVVWYCDKHHKERHKYLNGSS